MDPLSPILYVHTPAWLARVVLVLAVLGVIEVAVLSYLYLRDQTDDSQPTE